MKKYVQFSILSLLLFMMEGITNAQNWVNLGSSTPKEIRATATESNNQSIRVLFDTKGFNTESINEGNAVYQRLSIPGAGKTQTVGSPELPLFRQMVAIPECSEVSLSFQVLQEQVLNNYNVYPAPDYQVITNSDSTCYVEEVFSKNALCYVDNLVSPSNNVELSETGHFRSQKYAEIQVSPIRYNPATQKLYVATEIEVTLTLTNATGATSANLGIFNNVAAHTMLNYESTGMTAEVNDMRLDGGSVTFFLTDVKNEQEEEFYTCTKWYDSKINFVRYFNHFKDVEVVRMMDTQQNEPDNLVIYDWDIIQDATAGVVYGVDHNLHTDSAYVSTDFGHTWTAISPSWVDNHPVYFWTFPNSPGVIAKGNQWSDFQVSNDFGSHFEAMETGPLSNCFSGWSNGEFFDLYWQNEIGMMLHRTTDYYQTLETINQTLPEYHWNYLGAVEGEFYKLYYAGPESNEARLYYSNDYGQNCRLLMEFDSTMVSTPLHGEGLWSVWIGREPGVFYTFKREYRYDASEEGTKIYINYYRSYGDTLVTTYFHHFAPDWFDHHTPVMDCEIVSCDNNGVRLHWNEPGLRPEEVLVGYRVYRGETLISGDLITETEYTDHYSGNGRLKYHVLAVYSDGETSKSYNIVYCEQMESVNENGAENATVTLSPNPTSGLVRIEGTTAAEVQVYNALGQCLKTAQATNEIDLKGLPQGVYLLRITNGNGATLCKKIVRE